MTFEEYVYGFYGQGDDSIWAEKFFPSTGGVTMAEIRLATKIRLLNCELPFDGDSIDREIVRDILINSRNPVVEIEHSNLITTDMTENEFLKVRDPS